MACATAVWAREVRSDVVVPHSKVSQIVDILGLVCQTDILEYIQRVFLVAEGS